MHFDNFKTLFFLLNANKYLHCYRNFSQKYPCNLVKFYTKFYLVDWWTLLTDFHGCWFQCSVEHTPVYFLDTYSCEKPIENLAVGWHFGITCECSECSPTQNQICVLLGCPGHSFGTHAGHTVLFSFYYRLLWEAQILFTYVGHRRA